MEKRKTDSKNVVKSLNPGLNFINIIRTAFAPADPKSVKRY
jgi:hypothetical protein